MELQFVLFVEIKPYAACKVVQSGAMESFEMFLLFFSFCIFPKFNKHFK